MYGAVISSQLNGILINSAKEMKGESNELLQETWLQITAEIKGIYKQGCGYNPVYVKELFYCKNHTMGYIARVFVREYRELVIIHGIILNIWCHYLSMLGNTDKSSDRLSK